VLLWSLDCFSKEGALLGSDTVSNAVALCLNCHRQLHHGANATELAARLVLRVEWLLEEK
jgi:5-methylcytosine-specific restriction protein A